MGMNGKEHDSIVFFIKCVVSTRNKYRAFDLSPRYTGTSVVTSCDVLASVEKRGVREISCDSVTQAVKCGVEAGFVAISGSHRHIPPHNPTIG